MKKHLRLKKGFTLIEILVAITIFMVFITTISSAYLDIARSQRQANAVREVYSEIRYVFDLIGDEVRAKTIDYGCPGRVKAVEDSGFFTLAGAEEVSLGCNDLVTVPRQNYLALVNRERTERTVFLVEEDTSTEEKQLLYYKETKEPFNNVWSRELGFEKGFIPIKLRNIDLQGLQFEISPLGDPFDFDNVGCGAIQFQPSVSIYASINGNTRNTESFHLDLQTSVSSRVYNFQTSA